MSSTASNKTSLYVILPLFAIVLILRVDPTSLFSYTYTLLVFFLFHRLIREKDELMRNFMYFHYYLAVAIALFCIFRYQIPEYLGMTGPEGGIGTDDCRFYAQLKHGNGIFYPIRISMVRMHSFTKYLLVVYPFELHTPLNIVIFNLTGICFLPYYVRKLTYEIFNDQKLADKAALFTFLCPFTTYYGCILMRDTMVATLVVAGIYYYMRRNKIALVAVSLLLMYIRFGSFPYMMLGILLTIRRDMQLAQKNTVRFTILIIVLVALFNIFYEYIQYYSNGKLGDSVIRNTGAYFEGSTISKIMSLPFPVNVALSTFFFMVNPMLGWIGKVGNIYLMSSFFKSLLNGAFFLFLWPFIFNAIFSSINYWKNATLQFLIMLMFGFCAVLGSIDLQIRHKTIVFPILCMVAAYGMVRYDKHAKITSTLLGMVMLIIQLVFFIVKISSKF